MPGTDDFCEIVEQAKANSHQDQHRHQEDVTQEDEDNDDSTNQDQQAPSNPFANFAFGGGTVLVVAATPSGGKRKEFKGGAMRKNARARKSEGLNFGDVFFFFRELSCVPLLFWK